MKVTEDFISNIMTDFELNKAQFELLSYNYPPEYGWETSITEIEIDQRTFDLLVLLKGKIALKTQSQIIKNYDLLHTLLDQEIKESTYKTSSTKLKIYCDGACEDNPGEAGSGITVYNNDDAPVLYYGNYIKNGTNNIAELNALIKALKIAMQSDCKDIIIYSDSKYSIDCITNWSYSWKRNGWTKNGGEIKNLSLIQEGHNLYNEIKDKIIIEHVKGHSGIEGNELSDRIAVNEIKKKNIDYLEYKYKNLEEVLNLKSY